jgi:hypothetical protein
LKCKNPFVAEFVLKGRGFSRAANASKSRGFLAAAGKIFQN